jgi:ribosomal-protein-alanine N-acetyltransferase
MKLNTERLYIRDWKNADMPSMIEMLNERKVHEFTRVPYPYDMKEAKKFMDIIRKDKKSKHMGVFLKETDELVGSCSLKDIDTKIGKTEMGYIVHRSHRKKGFATEIGRALLKHAFETLKLNKVNINCVIENKASANVIKKLGAKREGILRKDVIIGDRPRDHVINSILREEYIKKYKKGM